MKPSYRWLVIVVAIVVVVLVLSAFKNDTEKYGTVLGQLAPYQKQLNECINECNRSDPSRRFLGQSNINCGIYCEAVISAMANKGIPPEAYPISNNMTRCRKQCDVPGATHNEKRKCLSMCYGENEAAQWCKELWCPYSLFPPETCMKQCLSTWTTNNNQVAWKWDMSR